MSSSKHEAALFQTYAMQSGAYDEWIAEDGAPRPAVNKAFETLGSLDPDELAKVQSLAERVLYNQGVTFSVYSDTRGTEKIFPFCVLPRAVSASDWDAIDRGLCQRVRALGMFLDDVYGRGQIFRDGKIPEELVREAKQYFPVARDITPAGGVRIHIAGIDLIRDADGTFRVLEDNLRTPSGVSYVLENRLISKRVLPKVVEEARIQRVDLYPARLAEMLRSVSPIEPERSSCVVLSPGPYNSAYFEHTFLARTMGLDLVVPDDLFVSDDEVFVRTTRGARRVHVIYRRIDDAFLDPEVFRPDSLLGVKGLFRAYKAGKVTIANAIGNGVADDKAVYAFVPEIIRYYLSEEPILAQVPTYVCAKKSDLSYVVHHLEELVVKAVDEAGGYGMLMGPSSTASEREEFKHRILAEPRKYIAQPRIELSTCPTWDPQEKSVVARRVDLRPYILTGPKGSWVLPGGLTRVALRRGSYVVNSSQGGGSKDTWVQKP